jgi:hypothetical protein
MKPLVFFFLAAACNAATRTAEPSSPTAKSETPQEIVWREYMELRDKEAKIDDWWRNAMTEQCMCQLETTDRLDLETEILRTETVHLRRDLDALREEMIRLRENVKTHSKEGRNNLLGPEEEGNEFAVFVNSEPIVGIEDDGNFTVGTPPERPSSAPLPEI